MLSDKRLLVIVFFVGIALLTTSVVFMQNVGKTAYFSGATPVEDLDGYDTIPERDTVSYEALPSAAQDSIDAAIANEDHRMYHPQDTEAIDALSTNRFVEVDGVVYLVELSHGDGFIIFVWIRWALAAIGGLLAVVGIGQLYRTRTGH